MATKYSQAGFNFSTASGEVAGVAQKIVALAEKAANAQTKAILVEIEKNLNILTEAIKKLEEESLKEQNAILETIHKYYSSLVNGVKTHINSPNSDLKAAAVNIKKYIKPIKDVFVSKRNIQLANIKSIIKLLKKCKAENFELLKIDSYLDCMAENYDLYIKKFPTTADGRVQVKETSLINKRDALAASLKKLRTAVEYFQKVQDGGEEEFVKRANDVWKLARQGQLISKSNKNKDDDPKDED